jgi:hypothetical protein
MMRGKLETISGMGTALGQREREACEVLLLLARGSGLRSESTSDILRKQGTSTAPVHAHGTPDSGRRRKQKGLLTVEQMRPYFGMPLAQAAKKLKICTSLLIKQCRKRGISDWPYTMVRACARSRVARWCLCAFSQLQGLQMKISNAKDVLVQYPDAMDKATILKRIQYYVRTKDRLLETGVASDESGKVVCAILCTKLFAGVRATYMTTLVAVCCR